MKINSLILIIFVLTFTGCINITKEIPAYSTYTLSVNNSKQVNQNSTNLKLEIKEPKALHSINSKYISYSTKNYTSENYALSKWSDSPTNMIQTQMVKYLASTYNYTFVNNSNINVRSDWQVLSEIISFHQSFQDEKAFVEFSINIYLKNRNNTYYKNFTYTQQCEQNNALGAVKALNVVVNSFVQDLDKWILDSIKTK